MNTNAKLPNSCLQVEANCEKFVHPGYKGSSMSLHFLQVTYVGSSSFSKWKHNNKAY